MWMLHTGIEIPKKLYTCKQTFSNKDCTQQSNRVAHYKKNSYCLLVQGMEISKREKPQELEVLKCA